MNTNMSAARHILLLLLLFFMISIAHGKSDEHASTVFFKPSNDVQKDLDSAMSRAAKQDKKLVVVLGAQWCHDSRGFAANMQKPELAEIMRAHYETLYIDVGYFNDLRAISAQFGQAHYFATPTVYIIDPKTKNLLNDRDLAMWGKADSLPFADYLEYFSRYAAMSPSKANTSLAHQAHLDMIEDFKSENAERLMKAYEHLVPAMQKEDKTGLADDTFYQEWNEVRDFRMTLQGDIDALYLQAETLQAEASLNTNKNPGALVLPVYPAFSWEVK